MSIIQSNQILNRHYAKLYGFEKEFNSSIKPKLVLLHGLLGNSQNWTSIVKPLEKDFRILTYDLRGHGRTGKFDDQYEPEVFSEDLIGILDELGWDTCTALGHSLGGRILMVAGAKHPERFERLVIEDMGPQKTGEASKRTEVMINLVPTPFSSRTDAKSFFKEQFQPRYGKVLSDYLYSNLKELERGQMEWRFDKEGVLKCLEIGHKKDFWDFYKSISSKHLVMRGEFSEHLPFEVMNQMTKSNSKAISVEIF